MIALRSALFNVAFFAWSALVMTLGLPVIAFGRRAIFVLGRLWVRGNFTLLAVICGLRHRIVGREVLPQGPFVVASKHQSAWDTMIFCLIFQDCCFVLKKELLKSPLFGLYLRHSQNIAVDRQGGAKALRSMLRLSREAAEAGRTIIIFPEGTRTAPGATHPYHPGVSALYSHLNLPVVPVALNSGLFWGRRAFLKHPGQIQLEFLEPLPPGLPRKTFESTLKQRIENVSARLAAAGRDSMQV